MLQLVLRLYIAAMNGGINSPVAHLFGPPGCGKSTVVQQAASLLGVRAHVLNVSRISPLDLEGIQMPDKNHTRLQLLLSTFWNDLQDGDIVHLDELLRGFPEVFNGLLDIITSREVAGYKLPKVFFIASSNTTVTYDPALEDRLLHIPVADPRVSKSARKHLIDDLVKYTGMYPDIAGSDEMKTLLEEIVLPPYNVLDSLNKGGKQHDVHNPTATGQTFSIRHLIGQVRLRHIVTSQLRSLVAINNIMCLSDGKPQFYIYLPGAQPDHRFTRAIPALSKNIDGMTPILKENLHINLQLISMEETMAQAQKDAPAKSKKP